MLKNFNKKIEWKMDKGQFVLYFMTETFRTVFIGVGPPLNKIFSWGMSFD